MSDNTPQTNSSLPPTTSTPERLFALSSKIDLLQLEQNHIKEIHNKDIKNLERSIETIKDNVNSHSNKIEDIEKWRWKFIGICAIAVPCIGWFVIKLLDFFWGKL